MAVITKLGIIAGGGDIPRHVISFCRRQGIPFFVVALTSHTSAELTDGVPHMWARIGEVGTIIQTLKNENVKEIMMIGSVRRPSLREIRPDWEGMKMLAGMAKKALGDDGLLRLVMAEIEKRGFKVVGVDEVLPELLAKKGIYGRIKPKKQDMTDIKRGLEVAFALGELDIGQGVVVQEGIVIAVEAIEGTDAMIARAGGLKRDAKGPVLVKVKKPRQDSRADLPTIGKETVVNAAANGFSGIAVQAGGIIVINRDDVIREADERGLFIMGMEPGQ